MPNRLLSFLLFSVLLVSSACNRYYYAPNTLQTPYLREKHDSSIGIGYLSGNQFSGVEVNAVYSPVKHGAIMANYVRMNSSRTGTTENEWGFGQLGEIALGGYTPVGDIVSTGAFAGWGIGQVLNSYEPGATADLRFQRAFFQPYITMQSEWIRMGIAVRFNQLRYVRGDVDLQIGEPHIGTIEQIEQASPMFFREVNLTFGLGSAPFWFNGFINVNQLPNPDRFGFARSTIGASMQVQLDYFLRAKPKHPEKKD